jgi:hypothetical protein
MKGGARLDASGNFEVYLNSPNGDSKCPCNSQSWKQYIRELFDYLMSSSTEPKQIGERLVYKFRFSTGSWAVSLDIEGMTFQLIRGKGEFATFALHLPFVGVVGVSEDMVGVSSDPQEEYQDAP